MENYYKIIGVSENSDALTIKSAYLEKVKQYHPDIYDGDKVFAEQMTAKINEAYNTLKDVEKRDRYDAELKIKNNNLKNEKKEKIKKQNNFKVFFKKLFKNIKMFFVSFYNKIKYYLSEYEKENKEKKRLRIIITIQTILILILIILLICT